MKKITCGIMATLLFLGILLSSMKISTSQETPVIKILDAQTASNSTSLGSVTEPVPAGGHPFSVSVKLDGATNYLFTIQVAVAFDRTKVRCTAAWIPTTDENFVFYGKQIALVDPFIDNDFGYVVLGVSLIGDYYVNVLTSALLCRINFTAIKTGISALEVIPTDSPLYPDDTFLWSKDPNDPENLREISFTSQSFSVTTVAGPTSPVASFTFTPSNPQANQNVTFDASESYDPDGNITYYIWDFDDGPDENTTQLTVTHNYTSNDVYLVNLTVADDTASFNSIIREVQVGRVPYVKFTYEPLEVGPLEQVTFNASLCYDPDGNIASYVWNFDDGNVTTVYNVIVTHSFSAKGVFLVNLTVNDNEGLHNSSVVEVFVGQPPTASFTFYPASPHANEVVTFNASQSQPGETGDSIALLVWNFDDFNITEVDVTSPSSFVIQHVYMVPGNYTVNLTVYDNNGLYNSYVHDVTIQETPKGPDYTIYIIAGAAVAFVVIATVAVSIIQRRRRAASRRLRRKQLRKTKSSK